MGIASVGEQEHVQRLTGALGRGLTLLVPLSPVIGAWLYVLGHYYSKLYLGGLGISVEFLNPSATSMALSGAAWHVSALGAFVGLALGMGIAILLVVVAMLAAMFAASVAVHVAKRALKAREKSFSSSLRTTIDFLGYGPADGKTESFAEIWRRDRLSVVGVLVVLATLSVMAVTELARERVRKDLTAWTSLPATSLGEFTLNANGSARTVRGVLIACGDSACAIWTQSGVLQVTRSEISTILGKPAMLP